jgi:hypothetical protein
MLALLLLALAGFLIIWGKEPKRTEAFVEGLPFGNYGAPRNIQRKQGAKLTQIASNAPSIPNQKGRQVA